MGMTKYKQSHHMQLTREKGITMVTKEVLETNLNMKTNKRE